MSCDFNRLTVTIAQMNRLIRAFDDLRENVLTKDPILFATMAEGPLDDLEHLRREIRDRVDELQPAG